MWTPPALARGRFLPGRSQDRRTRTYRPEGLCQLEGRALLTHETPGGGAFVDLIPVHSLGGPRDRHQPSSASLDQGRFVLAPPEYYPQAIPTSDRGGIVSTNPLW